MTQKPKHEKYPTVNGWTVWRWPEFQSFVKRLGLNEAPLSN